MIAAGTPRIDGNMAAIPRVAAKSWTPPAGQPNIPP
jgi:hypothetical protein